VICEVCKVELPPVPPGPRVPIQVLRRLRRDAEESGLDFPICWDCFEATYGREMARRVEHKMWAEEAERGITRTTRKAPAVLMAQGELFDGNA
jgi:hypothetical protein